MVALKRALAPHSYVFLEVKTGNQVVMFPIWTFPDASRYYNVAITAPGLQLCLKDWGLLGALSMTVRDGWFIWNTLTNQRIDLPKYVWLGPWSTRALKRILSAEEIIITPIVVHNHEFDFGNTRSSDSRPLLQPAGQLPEVEFV